MMTTMNSAFEEHKRKCEIYLKMIPNFRKELLIDKVNPKTTMQIYFGTIKLADYIKSFLEVRKEFLSLYTFRDIFEEVNLFPVNDLWFFVDNVNTEKYRFSYLIDGDFLNSRSRTLKLWEVNYEDIIDNYEDYLYKMLILLKEINDKWFDFHKHLELDNDTKDDKIFLDKENMEIYKLIVIPEGDNNLFKLKRVQYYLSYQPQITEVLLDPDNIRAKLKYEIFLDERLGEFFPEYFL